MADPEKLITNIIVVRSPEEIKARIEELENCIELNRFYIHRGADKIQEAESSRVEDLLRAKLNELRWLGGEEVEVTDGVI